MEASKSKKGHFIYVTDEEILEIYNGLSWAEDQGAGTLLTIAMQSDLRRMFSDRIDFDRGCIREFPQA